VPQSRTNRNVLQDARRIADRARLLATTGVSTQANPEPSDASDSGVSGGTTGLTDWHPLICNLEHQ
jgi:hypothetical protein